MTFREKLAQEHPELISPDYAGGCAGCPYFYGYEPYHSDSCDSDEEICRACWDRVIPLPPEEDVTYPVRRRIPESVRDLIDSRIVSIDNQIKFLQSERQELVDFWNGKEMEK